MKKSLVICSFAVLLSAGCATNPPIPTQPFAADKVLELENFGPPSGDVGRVYFFNGPMTGTGVFTDKKHSFPSALIVDGTVIGRINSTDVLVADLKPGNYEFMWRHAYAEDNSKSKPMIFGVVGGEVLILQATYNLGGVGFGLMGSLLSPPSFELVSTNDRGGVEQLNFVKATSCPTDICSNVDTN